MKRILSLVPLLLLGLSNPVSAQTVQTLPQGFIAKNGNSASFVPWNNFNSTGQRAMWIYDSSHFKSTQPVLIQRLRWRSHAQYKNWIGGTHPNVTINLSTSPLDYKSASNTFANNHGKDKTAVFKGTVTITPSTHKNGRWYVEISLNTPFRYDPGKGDLTIEYVRPAGVVSGSAAPVDTLNGSIAVKTKSNQIVSYNSATSTTGTVGAFAAIVELTWVPTKGLHSWFTADKRAGPSPLTVQFMDKTHTSTTGGVKSWAWDFNGDNKIDSTAQNPTWTFPKTGWDATHDVTLTTTDGVFPTSRHTKKSYITVDPSGATAVDFGTGSTSTLVTIPIPMPKNITHLSSSTAIRGFYFIAPANMVITGFEAPNNYFRKQTHQTVTCYVLPKAPATSYKAKAADIRFHGTGKSNTELKPTKPIGVTKGQWVGILGATHGTSTTSLFRNSYGNVGFGYKSTVLGRPVTLKRLWMNSNTRVNKGLGSIGQGGRSTMGRIFVHVAGNTTVPKMTTIGVPKLGSTPKLEVSGNIPGIQGGVLLMSAGRLPTPIKTPFGTLLNRLPFYLTILVPTGTGQVPFPIPAQPTLKGVVLDFQTLVFDLKKGIYGMTNGTEWFVGK